MPVEKKHSSARLNDFGYNRLTWVLHRSKSILVTLVIFGLIFGILYLIATSFMGERCKNNQTLLAILSGIDLVLIIFYLSVIRKHIQIPFLPHAEPSSFTGAEAIRRQTLLPVLQVADNKPLTLEQQIELSLGYNFAASNMDTYNKPLQLTEK